MPTNNLTPVQIQSIADRYGYVREKLQEAIISLENETFRDVFEAEVLIEGDGDSPDNIVTIGNKRYYAVRIRPLGFDDSFLPDPYDEECADVQRQIINFHPMAFGAVGQTQDGFRLGSVVECKRLQGLAGGNIIVFDRVISNNFRNLAASQTSLSSVFNNSTPQTLSQTNPATGSAGLGFINGAAGNDRVAWRTAGTQVTIDTVPQNQFITRLVKDLKADNWNEAKEIVVLSTFRTPERQMAAVLGQVANQGISWYDGNYSSFLYKPDLRNIITTPSLTKQQKITQGAAVINAAIAQGNYMSKHLSKSAFDLRTRHLTYDEAVQLLEVVRRNPYSRSADWENVLDRNGIIKGNNTKRQNGQIISGEHIHLSLTPGGASE